MKYHSQLSNVVAAARAVIHSSQHLSETLPTTQKLEVGAIS